MRGQLEQISKQYPELQKSADAAKESADLSKHVLEGTDAATFRINEISPTRRFLAHSHRQFRESRLSQIGCDIFSDSREIP